MANRLWRKMLSKSGIHRHNWLEYEILLLLCNCLFLKNACVNLFYTHFSLVYKGFFVEALILCAKFVCGVFWGYAH